MRQLIPVRRYAVLVCFLWQTYRDTIDHMVDMHDKIMTGVYSRAENQVDEEMRKRRKILQSSLDSFRAIGKVIFDEAVEDRALRAVIFNKIDQDVLNRQVKAADDVARFALIALEDPRTTGETFPIGRPENWTNMQVVALYEEIAGRAAMVSHVPLAALRLMAPVVRPFQPGLSQVMEISILDETADQTFDMTETLRKYPLTLTRLEDWVREHIPEEAVPAASPS